MNQSRMKRVNRAEPCLICEKPDWCLRDEDSSAAICARIEQGSVKRCGDAGWLHVFRENQRKGNDRKPYNHRIRIAASESAAQRFEQLIGQYQQSLTEERLYSLSTTLGVSTQSLRRLCVGWDGQAFTFPMSSEQGKIIGIRRRFPDGRKLSVIGSRSGLFVPTDLAGIGPLLISEGPTDTGVALDLGFDAIGRPSCNSGIDMTVWVTKGRGKVVVVADNDQVGKAGAARLARVLALHCPSVKTICPPVGTKDLRQWLRQGLSRSTVQSIIDRTESEKVQIQFKD